MPRAIALAKMQTVEQILCLHCGAPAAGLRSFCCAGCETVYDLLQSRGLGHFYELQKSFPLSKPQAANRTFIAEIQLDSLQAKFYLKGIHCLGCLWLLEKLPEIDSRIQTASLDFVHQILEIQIRDHAITWKEVAELIQSLGYEAKILEGDSDTVIHADQREQLVRIGLAGFCAGNIMLLSVSIYAGASGIWAKNFSWLSAALAMPVLLYSAWPIFRSAIYPLREKRISVDLAIALALIAGVVISFYSMLQGQTETYFDSLTMLVFLLLSSRYFLSRLRESIGKESAFLSFFHKETYARLSPSPAILGAQEIAKNDIFRLKQGQILPVDSRASSTCHFDLSMLTGESQPVKFLAGDRVDSGSKLISSEGKFQALADPQSSRLANILSQIKNYQLHRSKTLDFADQLGRYFVLVVLALSCGVIAAFPNAEGFRRALALIIVTCPCVLAFAVPLAFTRALQFAGRRGILFRHPEKLEAIAEAKTIFFDKTGTLTSGEFEVLEWQNFEGDESLNKQITASLEKNAEHPVGKSILRKFSAESFLEIEEWQEIPGQGVQGYFLGSQWKLSASQKQSSGNLVVLLRDDIAQAEILLGDKMRADSLTALQNLRAQGMSLVLLSGDISKKVQETARALGFDKWYAEVSPEEKAKIVAATPLSIMIGDGANDGIAFQSASVGIAVQGSVDLSLKNCDISFTQPGLESLTFTIDLARRSRKLIRHNFLFTLSYNILAGALAILGFMSPLIAAVLMPLSALSVFLFTQWRSNLEAK